MAKKIRFGAELTWVHTTPCHFRVRSLAVCVLSGAPSGGVCSMATPSHGTLHKGQAGAEWKPRRGLVMWCLPILLLPLRPEAHLGLGLAPLDTSEWNHDCPLSGRPISSTATLGPAARVR